MYEKNFNRAMSLVLAAAMALSLAACGGNQRRTMDLAVELPAAIRTL